MRIRRPTLDLCLAYADDGAAWPVTGVFVAFEGGDGGGKSTQCRLLIDRLRGEGIEAVATREPGGSHLGEQVRDLLLTRDSDGMDPRVEALLFAAARADHVARTVRPALHRGAIVVTDRYLDSSVAYQGAGRGLGEEWIKDLNLWATGNLIPDLTVLLDVDPEVGLHRAQDPNRLEAEPAGFHATVRDTFYRLAAEDPQRYLVLPASDPIAGIHRRVWTRMQRLLGGEE